MQQPVFSFRLAKQGSELYIGGTNTAKYTGPIEWHSLTSRSYWVGYLAPPYPAWLTSLLAHTGPADDRWQASGVEGLQFRDRHGHDSHSRSDQRCQSILEECTWISSLCCRTILLYFPMQDRADCEHTICSRGRVLSCIADIIRLHWIYAELDYLTARLQSWAGRERLTQLCRSAHRARCRCQCLDIRRCLPKE